MFKIKTPLYSYENVNNAYVLKLVTYQDTTHPYKINRLCTALDCHILRNLIAWQPSKIDNYHVRECPVDPIHKGIVMWVKLLLNSSIELCIFAYWQESAEHAIL